MEGLTDQERVRATSTRIDSFNSLDSRLSILSLSTRFESSCVPPCTALDLTLLCHPHSIMAPASANQKSHDVKHKKHASRASNPKPESESPVEANGDEPAYLKELNKFVLRSHCAWPYH